MKISHPLMVRTLRKDPSQIMEELTPHKMNILHAVIGVSGEAGELLDAVKKACVYNQPTPFDNIVEELGDIEFYLEQLRQALGITREQTIDANIAKLSIRYAGMVYSNEAAALRADKIGATDETA